MIFGQLNRAVGLSLRLKRHRHKLGPRSDGARAAQSLTPPAPRSRGRLGQVTDPDQLTCTNNANVGPMQLNVWLLIEIQFENTLGLINEKSNSLKSHGVGVDVFRL